MSVLQNKTKTSNTFKREFPGNLIVIEIIINSKRDFEGGRHIFSYVVLSCFLSTNIFGYLTVVIRS